MIGGSTSAAPPPISGSTPPSLCTCPSTAAIWPRRSTCTPNGTATSATSRSQPLPRSPNNWRQPSPASRSTAPPPRWPATWPKRCALALRSNKPKASSCPTTTSTKTKPSNASSTSQTTPTSNSATPPNDSSTNAAKPQNTMVPNRNTSPTAQQAVL